MPDRLLENSRKIAVIGCCGSGKSTLAAKLGALLEIPAVHLDAFYWHPGWVETPKAEWKKTVQTLVRGHTWIIDGNYSRTLDLRLREADTVIFLDFPRILCLWRVFKRWLQYRGRSRPDMADGCPERLSWDFIQWIWQFRQRRPQILQSLNQYAEGRQIFVLHRPSQVQNFLEDIQQSLYQQEKTHGRN